MRCPPGQRFVLSFSLIHSIQGILVHMASQKALRLSQRFSKDRPDSDAGMHFGSLFFTFRSMIHQQAVHPIHQKMAKGKLRHRVVDHKGNMHG